ncbi:MAG: glycoside hydrolase [Lachnospiraceae bacterium]|nr:glycoside hydrolase [Lachnospiraceae bacterium]
MRLEDTTLPMEDEKGLTRQVESNVVGLYPDYMFQKIGGFGCAMTESACYLLSAMVPEERKKALRCWFGPDGADAGFIRIPIDSCDYSLEEYQAVKDPASDPGLSTFNIDRDRKYILPVVKEALEMAGHPVSVLLSPWSPPAAWKTAPEMSMNDAAVYGSAAAKADLSRPGRCFGGRLKREYYGAWARYLVKYLQSYLQEGIPVSMLSVQNEASAATSWDSCLWTGEQEGCFLRDYLYPEMEKAGLSERIGLYIWDHNKERMVEHVDEVMACGTYRMVEGFAYHWYSGDHFEALSLLHGRYPDKLLMHSESCGLHIPGKVLSFDLTGRDAEQLPPEIREQLSRTPSEVDFEDAENYAHDIIGDIEHGMNRWIDWNMIVDRNGGPRHVPGGFAAPLIAEKDGTFSRTISYEYILEIARTVRPGAVRIGSSRYCQEVEESAVLNADGSYGVLLLNRSGKDLPAVIRTGGYLCRLHLPAHTLSTVRIEK